MGFMQKLKRNYEIWKIGKYTKRRAALTPEFEQRDKEYYESNYNNGIYSHQPAQQGSLSRAKSFRTTLSGGNRKDIRNIRSSEVYNDNHLPQHNHQHHQHHQQQVQQYRQSSYHASTNHQHYSD